MMKKRIMYTIVTLGILFMAISSYAGPAWEFTSAGNSYNDDTWDFAAPFTVNQTVTATGLGYYADPINGFVASNPVALYKCDSAGCLGGGATLLASATVTNIYPLTGHFRYVTISPIVLAPGDYEVAGVSFEDNYTWNDTGFYTDPNITYALNATRWELRSDPAFLNYINTNEIESDGFWGPNVFFGQPTFTGVPEPTTMLLLGLGLIGVAGIRRKFKS